MRIVDVAVTPVAFPDPPLLSAFGMHPPWALRTIVQVRTDDGREGLGETYGDDAERLATQAIGPRLVGLSPYDLPALRAAVAAVVTPDRAGAAPADPPWATRPQRPLAACYSAFEVAFLDLQAQAAGQPLHAILGGKVRERVPFAAYLFYKRAGHPGQPADRFGAALDPAGVVAQARLLVDSSGYESLKLKGGVFPPDEELAALRALRAEFPDLPLRWDPNTAWTPATSIRVGRAADGLLEYLEDPTPGLAGMAEVAAAVPMPLATNMCVTAFAQFPEAIARGSVGVVLGDHHYWGGLAATAKLAGICETFDLGLSMHSNSHLGISLAAMTHVAAATPRLTYACDTHTPWLSGDVVADPLRITAGAVTVPDTPGLGVTVDPAALARMHADFRRAGQHRIDQQGYLRRFEPAFASRVAYW